MRKMFLVVFPGYLPDIHTKPSLASGVANHCNYPQEHVRLVEHVHSFSQVSSIIHKDFFRDGWEPILFKNFLPKAQEKWSDIAKKHENASLMFSEVTELSFGNMWMPGIKPHGKVETNLRNITLNAENSSKESLFASFLPFLDKSSSMSILNMTENEYGSIIIDTNFVSNFKQTILATSIHSAVPPNSFGIQLVGKKLWLFLPPAEMERYDAINLGPTLLFDGSEASMIQSFGKYIVAVQEEGDLLFFPPQWGHAVVTRKGVNVMCNIRQTAFLKSFFTNPRKLPEALFAKLFLDGVNKPFNHASLNAAQIDLKHRMEARYRNSPGFVPPESGCKETWTKMLEE